MISLAASAHIKGPHVDWPALSPLVALAAGALIVLLLGLIRAEFVRERIVPTLSVLTLGTAIALLIARFPEQRANVVAGALAMDDLGYVLDLIFCAAALAAVLLSWRSHAAVEAGQGEYHSLLLFSVLGMAVLVSAQNLVTVFLGFELLSIPLYILCASESRRENSLESGLKYLVIGSVGSATLVYGFAMIYGATGSTFFSGIAGAIGRGGILDDPLLLTGIGLVVVGFAFKASVAPFHQWTPDVYEGAPTPITAFMATATKAAAFGVMLRFFDVAAIGQQNQWAPLLAALATITIVVGNVGALGQSSLKRLLAYSSVAQAGYMMSGVVVGTRLGIRATVFYLAVYLAMNLAAFAVIVWRERDEGRAAGDSEGLTSLGDELSRLSGLGARSPALGAAMTVAMLSLAGMPATVGFIGKFELIRALVDGSYTWLGIVLVVGSMISLAYYLRVVTTIWTGGSAERAAPVAPQGTLPAIAGGSPELDSIATGVAEAGTGASGEVGVVAYLFAAACIFFGLFPQPLFELVSHAGNALPGLF